MHHELICLCFPMPLNFICVSACVQYRLQCVGVNPYIMRGLMDITPKIPISTHSDYMSIELFPEHSFNA